MKTRSHEANRIIRVKHHTITALLWQAVFGKEDLMHTLYPRRTRRTVLSIVTRSTNA